MTADNPITDLLAAPLSPDWTVEGLAEQLLSAIAARPSEEPQEFVLDADATTDRQSRRVLRPLLACLATKSAAEGGTPADLYGGRLSFKRPGPQGPVWITGQFENGPGAARVVFRRQPDTAKGKEPRITISIQVSGDFEALSGEKREQLMSALSKIAQISPQDIKIEGMTEG
jgi:hypothetical protein